MIKVSFEHSMFWIGDENNNMNVYISQSITPHPNDPVLQEICSRVKRKGFPDITTQQFADAYGAWKKRYIAKVEGMEE